MPKKEKESGVRVESTGAPLGVAKASTTGKLNVRELVSFILTATNSSVRPERLDSICESVKAKFNL